jgi:hypothetical protein
MYFISGGKMAFQSSIWAAAIAMEEILMAGLLLNELEEKQVPPLPTAPRFAYSPAEVIPLICLYRVSRLQSPGIWLGG